MRNILREIRQWFKPSYSELSAYLIAVICIFILIVSSDFRQKFSEIFSETLFSSEMLIVWGMIFVVIAGGLLSIFNALVIRKKSIIEKTFMGIFILAANATASISAGIEMLKTDLSIMFIFPIANILGGIILIYQIGLERFEISDEDATFWEVYISTIILVSVMAALFYLLHLSWALTFSISLSFASFSIFVYSWIKYQIKLKSRDPSIHPQENG